MANYRQIHVSIWKDEWFLELEPQEKLLFIYLFGNESTSLCGMYKIALRVICFETGLDKQTVLDILDRFAKDGKAYYENGIVWIVNMRKYHETTSDLVQKRIQSDLNKIPDCRLKRVYIDGTGTLSVPYAYQKHKDEDVLKGKKENAPKNGAHSESAPNTPKPPKHPKRQELINHFLAKTGLPVPRGTDVKAMQLLWWTPIDSVLEFCGGDIDLAKGIIENSVIKLKADGMTISEPKSILKTARSVFAERNDTTPSNNASEVY